MEDARVLSTFGKNMICPYSIIQGGLDLPALGEADFSSYSYRHLSSSYKGEASSSTSLLLEYVKNAVEKSISKDKRPLLLLSDGKDSMSLALGFQEAEISCNTLTFLRREDVALKRYIEDVSKKLGHEPFFVSVDEILESFDADVFINACKEMKKPVLDQGFLFFLFGLSVFFSKCDLSPSEFEIVDGLGNDEYLGYLPSKSQFKSYSLSRYGLWKAVPNWARSLRWYVRSPAESHGDFSALACFFPFPYAYDLNKYFSRIRHSKEKLSYVDFRAFSRGCFHDHQCMMGKTRAAADFLGSKAVFPWLDSALSNHCFNIPVDEKFDFHDLKNKLPLRRLLSERVGWEQSKRGVDLFFDIDVHAFQENFLSPLMPSFFYEKINNNAVLPAHVKKRACLELLNFYGYCSSRGMNDKEIEKLLIGEG